MKLAAMIMLSLLSLKCIAFEISPIQESFIKAGHNCCYSPEVIAQVNQPTYEYQTDIILNLPPLIEPASSLSWLVFGTLQLLDVYSTVEAVKYDCIYEMNPLLSKKPELHEIIVLKTLILVPGLFVHQRNNLITDEELQGANYLMSTIIANNFHVWDHAKTNCNKNR